ncbi:MULTISPECIES: pyrroline-5-carboxylate reductase [unclassified Neisseria]|uniref:pyrroline-5-carboxylate reductase n=1 Tax=unclassified Neisseria TaxID=2623750 RepID=UPI001072047A|nr:MULTISPECIES: pyrroline-5-carboxylate reductase [unclassified Neisseria]MBF0804389.1 pyrroline-5-carboxylate reductase [Neisseria sp. 19428wB4_WF04]TFU42818.1 pyrroline-5-carboxylate reductase [Neisseria sp. WF04]
MDIYFLGGGNMAEAIAGGLVKQDGYRVCIADRSIEKRERLARELGVRVSEKLPALNAEDVLVLAVKPQDMQAACADVQTNGALVLSVAAGLGINTLSRCLGGTRRIVRVMPNTPAGVGLGVSGMFAGEGAGEADKRLAQNVMAAVGETVWLPSEAQMHAITAVSGSGPAYVFYLMNALQTAAVQQGFDEATARRLSLATFKGAAALAELSGEDFSILQQNVTSKGGTTAAAIEAFNAHRLPEAVAAGVEACAARSREIAQQFKAV